jgi:pyruvate,water dikinase
LQNYKTLGAEFVAVRSSATAEDGAAAAWAGQLDTYLNTTEETLLENVKRCWASLFTPRAIFYRFEKGLRATKISVAVVVQKMVNADAAGVAFSVHPVTEDRNQLIIEGTFGLGEVVVSGQVTPDSYIVSRDTREIVDKTVVEKDKGLFRKEGGGNEWRDVPHEKRTEQVLSDRQLMALTDIVLRVEKHYGFPVDIEWALEGDILFILQSRPITTLKTS